jgi:tetratricopeptide (TPR) repeat protein
MPECEWQRRLGDFFAEAHDDQRARDAYRNALALPQPTCLDAAANLAARQGLGDAALRLKDPASAVTAYAGIDQSRARTNRALALLALGRPREALDDARRALELAPNDPDAQLAERLARERLARPRP